MRLLLDTHAFLWWSEDDLRLKQAVRESIAEAEQVLVSVASAWEAAIKMALGKLQIVLPFEEAVEISQFSKLLIDFSHAAAVAALPHHHGDPFDRMLIAQAQVEGLTLVTHDRRFEPYRVPVLWT
ncbi:MAG: type II toxin-antitoxin system VapC family toxin [Gemmatimonadota bacterium]|nr:type II toxin-antitoxin system VapC family toxin [Gemmatimonadota bacterium]MDQ3605774.1 type II toxin-antitoxin system VapC family toxin [Gemmatimonadota bacterium]